MNRRIVMARSRAGWAPGSSGDKQEGLITLTGDGRLACGFSSLPHLLRPSASLTSCLLLPGEPPDSHTTPQAVRRILCFWRALAQRLGSWLAASWVSRRIAKWLGGALLGRVPGSLGLGCQWRRKPPGEISENVFLLTHLGTWLAPHLRVMGGQKERGPPLGKDLILVIPTAVLGACGVFLLLVKSFSPPC